MNEDIQDDVQLVMQHIYNEASGTHDNEPEEEIIHVHHYPDAQLIELPDGTVIFKKTASTHTTIPIVESKPEDSQANQPPRLPAYLMVSIFLLLALSSILFQLSVLFHPLTAHITLAARSQTVSLTGTLQLGRVVNPITLSQSQTVPATGHGHQDARAATGSITFYNASFSSQTVNAGIVLTGADGVQVITDEMVTVPPNTPPQDGQATVAAHAMNAGSAGNIQALAINGTLSSSLFVKNLTSFTGGQDERNFQTIAKSDIDNAASQLKETLNQATQGALQGQLKTNEALVTPSCTTTTTADHQIGQEASQVKVTVSETCSAVAYDQDRLQAKVTDLLTSQAEKKLGSGYGLLGNPQISIIQAASQNNVLNFASQSRWVYAISSAQQRHIKNMIAGKSKDTALQLLLSLPDIQSVRVQFSGFGDDTSMPKHTVNIHLALIYD